MSNPRVVAASPAAVAHVASRWWLWLSAPGTVLLLTPAVATAVTGRDPDPLFMHAWWTPIAQAPTVSLLLGSVGLDVLLATGVGAVIARAARSRRPIRPAVRTIGVIVLATLAALGWTIGAAGRVDASSSTITAVLGHGDARPADASSEARKAIDMALAWPDTLSRVRVLSTSSVPAGPWIVQTTEVLNVNAQDEGADVVVETLVEPTTGRLVAAWYYGV